MTMLRSWFIKEVVGLELDYMQVDGDMEGPASVREVILCTLFSLRTHTSFCSFLPHWE